MSVCLGAIKGIAVSSLGIYTGVLCTSTLISYSNVSSLIIGSMDLITQSNLKTLINRLFNFNNLLGTISATFFALSYFGAPRRWKHPYLLYSMIVPPLSSLYLLYIKSSTERKLCLQSERKTRTTSSTSSSTENKPIILQDENNDIDESIVDLGDNNTNNKNKSINSGVSTGNINTRQYCINAANHLLVASTISFIGLGQSLFGLYGEGQFV